MQYSGTLGLIEPYRKMVEKKVSGSTMEYMLKGKKTYICCTLAAIWSIACCLGWGDGNAAESKTVLTVLFSLAGISLRLGVKKNGE